MTGVLDARNSSARTLFQGACLAGLIHAAFSLYWALGGRWLLETVGRVAVAFANQSPLVGFWLLLAVALFKAAAAIIPLLNDQGKMPWPRLWRTLSWFGGPLLILYGGLNTVVAWGVLLDVLPAQSVDRAGLLGHAALWDPLFLVWGLSLTVALVLTRRQASQRR